MDNAGNGNTSDHAVIGTTRLTTNRTKPSITVSNRTYKLGENVSLTKRLSVFETEDANLTNQVEVLTKGLDESTPRRYEVVCQVPDSDGNLV